MLPEKESDFCHHFLKRFIECGFGTLSKKEVDRLVFAMLVDSGHIHNIENQFEISRSLKVSMSKAASLVYEYKLHKHPQMPLEQLHEEFAQLLKMSRFGKSGDRVILEIRDRRLREEFAECIHAGNLGCAPDYTFNKDLLLLDFNTFSALVEKFAGPEQMRRIEKELRKLKALPPGLPGGRALLGKFLEGVASRAGSGVVDLAGLLITGGVSTLPTAIGNLLATNVTDNAVG
jgi:hypothetical protein